MSSSERTPLPWVATDHGHATTIRADQHSMGKPIAEIWDNGDNRSANAAFIVKAVNAHDKLVEALEEISNMCPATAEMTLAHDMAQIATETLEALSLAKSETPQ